jgi:hypothetical protein
VHEVALPCNATIFAGGGVMSTDILPSETQAQAWTFCLATALTSDVSMDNSDRFLQLSAGSAPARHRGGVCEIT